MRTQFTAGAIDRLKRDAKMLRHSNPLLKQNQALDQIAQQNGWSNWALLQKNSVMPSLSELFESVVQPFEPGDRGVFFFSIAIRNAKICAELERVGGLSFELPRVPSNWLIRRFTEIRNFEPDPYLNFGYQLPRGKFVKGKFLCIVSTNGVQKPDIENEIAARLMLICAQLQGAAIAMAEMLLQPSSMASRVRLFFSRPSTNGVHQVDEQTFETLEAAQNAKLPPGAQPIGIPSPDGWWLFQLPFGWQPPQQSISGFPPVRRRDVPNTQA